MTVRAALNGLAGVDTDGACLAAPAGSAVHSSLPRMLCSDTMLLEWNACGGAQQPACDERLLSQVETQVLGQCAYAGRVKEFALGRRSC